MSAIHSHSCSCAVCHDTEISRAEKEMHIEVSENSRREFIKKAGRFGLSLGIGGGLITAPLAASALHNEDATYKANSMFRNKAVQNGKASMLTLLHTADIHSQITTHDEFFIENG